MLKERQILFLLKTYFVLLFFYGILIKLTIWNTFLFEFKTLLPEILLIILCIDLAFKTLPRINLFSVVGLCWYGLIIIINSIFAGSFSSAALHSFRDCYIPTFLAIFLYQYPFQKTSLQNFSNFFIRLAMVYLIAGALLGIVERVMGVEWSSKFYTGYEFYGGDDSGVKISEANGRLRAPGLTGNSASFAFYAVAAMVFLFRSKKVAAFLKICLFICGVIIIWSTANKTAYIGLAGLIVFYIASRFCANKKYKRLKSAVLFIAVMVAICCIPLFIKAFPSFHERVILWTDIFDSTNPFELIFPYRAFMYGAGGEEFTSILDNAYIYFLLSGGIIGVIWTYAFALKMANDAARSYGDKYLFLLLIIFLLLASFTTNITQGRAYFSICFIILALYSKCKIGRLAVERVKLNDIRTKTEYEHSSY